MRIETTNNEIGSGERVGDHAEESKATLLSQRLSFKRGQSYASVTFRPLLNKAVFGLAPLALFFCVWLLWVVLEDLLELSLVLFVYGGLLVLSVVTLLWSVAKSVRLAASSHKFTVAKHTLIIEKNGLFSRQSTTFDLSAIECIRIVPDEFSRPYHGATFRKKWVKLQIEHAGEAYDVFRNLRHAEAIAASSILLDALPHLALRDLPNSPGAVAPTLFEFNTDKQSETGVARRIRVARNQKNTLIAVKPHLDRRLLFHCAAWLLAVGLITNGKMPTAMSLPDQIVLCLLIFATAAAFLNLFWKTVRRDRIWITRDCLEYTISRLFFFKHLSFKSSQISKAYVTMESDTSLLRADLEIFPVFAVSFDYGQTTRDLGTRLTYREAAYLADRLNSALTSSQGDA